MTEPAIKRRVLTKVRRHFLHKAPPNEDEIIENANFIATPEQLNENIVRLLEPYLGLVETNRAIYAGIQYLNLHYKIAALRIERQFLSQAVTLDLQTNNVDMLPWEYCAERLESYGDLELATWGRRLRTYHQNYSRMMEKYFAFINSRNPEIVAAIAKGKAQATLTCRDIESKCVYRKVIYYADKNSLIPISITLHEGFLKDIGHSVDSFAEWTKKHGVPALFKKDAAVVIEYCKQGLARGDSLRPFVQEGPEISCDLYDKKGGKKPVNIKVFSVMHPAPEGFFITLYSIIKDPDPDVISPKSSGLDDILSSKKSAKT